MFKKYLEILGWLLMGAAALGNRTLGGRGVATQHENWLFKKTDISWPSWEGKYPIRVCPPKLHYMQFPDTIAGHSLFVFHGSSVCLVEWCCLVISLKKRELAELETYSSLFNFLVHRS